MLTRLTGLQILTRVKFDRTANIMRDVYGVRDIHTHGYILERGDVRARTSRNGVRYKAYIERQVVPRSLLLQRFCPPRSSTIKFLVSNKGRIEIERSRKEGLSSTTAWNYV